MHSSASSDLEGEIALDGNANEKVPARFGRPRARQSVTIVLTAVVVGCGAGLGAVALRWLIDAVHHLSYDTLGGLLQPIEPFHLLILPALGGLAVGVLAHHSTREVGAHGVTEVIEAVASRTGTIRLGTAVVEVLASAICIGTGGSVGRLGPIAEFGSAIGSSVARFVRLRRTQERNLVACGAAGGISAMFNAPIAGSVFALEVVLGEINAGSSGLVVISAVTADAVTHAYTGDVHSFCAARYALVSGWELLVYVLLGLIAALVGVAFTRLLYLSQGMWSKVKLGKCLRPALGGLLLGIIGVLTFKTRSYPRVFGVGYDTIADALNGELAIQMTLALLALKLLATITVLGSGGRGGIFAPALFMGAMLGSTFGQIANLFIPEATSHSGAYALVGMAALFGAATQAPATAILILFEMSRDYALILPLMLATVVSSLVSGVISQETIYTRQLSQRRIHVQQHQDIDVT